MSEADIDVSVVVVNYNTRQLLPALLNSLHQAAQTVSAELIAIDNASSDGSPAWLQRHVDGRVILNAVNVGFGRANNQALGGLRGRYVLLLNTDAFVAPDTLSKTIAWMDAHPQHGVLGVRLVGRDGALQPSCRYFPTPFKLFLARTGLQGWCPWVRPIDDMDWPHDAARECDWVPGCYYLVRREVVAAVGLFDARYFMYYEEVDHCRRVAAAGWRVVFFPETEVVHLGGESAQSSGALSRARQLPRQQIESELLYLRKFHGRAGLLGHILLVGLGDLWLMAKQGMKWLLGRAAAPLELYLPAVLQLTRSTRFGAQPTR